MVVTCKNNIFCFFPQFYIVRFFLSFILSDFSSILYCQISLANLATGLAFKVLASGIGPVVNFADWACFTNSIAAGLYLYQDWPLPL